MPPMSAVRRSSPEVEGTAVMVPTTLPERHAAVARSAGTTSQRVRRNRRAGGGCRDRRLVGVGRCGSWLPSGIVTTPCSVIGGSGAPPSSGSRSSDGSRGSTFSSVNAAQMTAANR